MTDNSDPRVVDVLSRLAADRTVSPRLKKADANWAGQLRKRQAR